MAAHGENKTEAAHQPPRQLVAVTDLRRRLGQRQPVQVDVILAEHTVVSSRTTDEPVTGELIVESIERGVSVTGAVSFSWVGDCRRCLESTGGRASVNLDEIFQIDAPEDSEINDLDSDKIDLIPLVLDAVVLSLPLAPLCRADCAGPDPDRYPAQTYDQLEEARAAQPDPRWAGLADFTFNPDDD